MLLGLRHIMDDVFFFKQKTAYEVRISDWRSDVCSSDLIAHYALAGRDDTPFWRDVAAAGIPDSLAERIEAFRATGNILFEPGDLFGPTNWYAVLTGQGVRPQSWHPIADGLSDERSEERRGGRERVGTVISGGCARR